MVRVAVLLIATAAGIIAASPVAGQALDAHRPAAGHPAERLVAPGELARALEDARPGDILTLMPGIHPGPLQVTTPVALVGRPGAVIAGPGQGTVLTLAAPGIRVSGLEIRGSGDDLSTDTAVVLLAETRDVTVQHCRIHARAFGIYLRAGGGHRIVDNEVHGDPGLATARRGNGIHLWHSTDNHVRGNRLAGVRDGVYLSFAHENEIRDNVGTDLRYGIHYMYSERNLLAGNRFANCTGGIALMFSMGNRIEDNETTDNRDFGILCQQLERSIIAGNTSAGNGRGFFVENSAGNRFEANVLGGNGVGVYLTGGSEANVFTANRFERNLVQVYRGGRSRNRWADEGRGNFWSDYPGFDWDGDGVGEAPYRLETASSALAARQPRVRWLWTSPVLALLDWWAARVFGLDPEALDPMPLIHDDPTARRWPERSR